MNPYKPHSKAHKKHSSRVAGILPRAVLASLSSYVDGQQIDVCRHAKELGYPLPKN
jgi:uncharacterized PurR-regulated membrane protein YhhQ (DUF165 family)